MEGASVLDRGCRTRLIGQEDTPALHVSAREYDLSDRNLGLNVYHSDLSRVPIELAHGFQELRLPLEPWHVRGIPVRPHNREQDPNANTLFLAPTHVPTILVANTHLLVLFL